MIRTWLILILFCFSVIVKAQYKFKFAHISDTHIGSVTGAEDLRRTVKDINRDTSIKFVVHTGDVTEFGSDIEIQLAKQILDSLNKPWYVVPGNHDANWSESGANTFRQIFGSETVAFEYGGYLFLGTGSGPNMRMGPGQIPRENLVWLNEQLNRLKNKKHPVIFLNHYPQDTSLNNWYEVIDALKKHNTQLILCGHGHNNHQLNFEGIPAIMGRSNLRAKDSVGGYNIVTVFDDYADFQTRIPGVVTKEKWATMQLKNHFFQNDTTHYFRPSYAINKEYPQMKKLWEYVGNSDIGVGTAVYNDLVICADTDGNIFALDKKTGKKIWTYHTKGKIYSTPAVEEGKVVVASTDKNIYCLNASTGKLIWNYTTDKPNVASPLIYNRRVFIGGSDGHFRAFSLTSGQLLWDFPEVKGFVVDRPLFYHDNIYFGCWANDFYALNAVSGKLVWRWNNSASNRMYSPAACWPVASNGRIFIVAPDRYMTALSYDTGKEVWRKQLANTRVRESMGISQDSSLVYVKTMEGEVYGVSTKTDSMQLSWHSAVQLGYEICPSPIVENKSIVYVPTGAGIVAAINRTTGAVYWKYKTSNCLVNSIQPIENNCVLISTMDGKITCLEEN